MTIFHKVFCFIFGHSWVITRRKRQLSYSYYQYTCTCCNATKEEV